MSAGHFIRAAIPRERKFLYGRFPALGKGGGTPRIFVVPDRSGNGLPCGFGVLQPPGELSADSGSGRIYLFVGPDHRRKGMGAALLRRMIEAAAVMGLQNLETLKPIEADDPARLFLRRHGFESVTAVTEFQVDPARMVAPLEPAHQYLTQRGKIPSGAKLVPIEQSPVSDVRKLVVESLPRLDDELEPDLRSFIGTESRALMVDGELYGAMLEKTAGDAAFVHAIAVAPGRRNTWAAIHLKHAVYSALAARGLTLMRFRAVESIHKDTVKDAHRAQAEVLTSTELFRLDLTSRAEPPRTEAAAGEQGREAE